jgi:hypothetical protein
VTSDLIRNGHEVKIKGINGIKEQIYQVAMDYPGASDPTEMELDKIRFYYEGLHSTLKQTTRKDGK